jgi:hypothetical protein
MPTPRLADTSVHRKPWAKGLARQSCRALWPKPQVNGLVIAINENSEIIH